MSTNSTIRPTLGRRLVRFALLWSGCLAVILMLAGVEALILWQRGYTYRSKSSLLSSWLADLSLDRQGNFGAGLMTSIKNGNDGSWNDVVLIDLDRQVTQNLQLRELKPECVAMAPRADGLAVASQDGSIYAVTGPTTVGSRTRLRHRLVAQTGGDQVLRLNYSPDGHFLGAISANFVWVWEWPSGTLVQRHVQSALSRGFLAFSPDSRCVLSPRGSGVCLTDLTSKGGSRMIEAGEAPIVRAVPDFDLKLAALVSYGQVIVRDFQGGILWEEDFTSPVVTLDLQRKILAIASAENNYSIISLRDLVTGQPLGQLAGNRTMVGGLAFSHDGLLYGWDFRGGLHAWNVPDSRMLWSISPAEQSSSPADLASRFLRGDAAREYHASLHSQPSLLGRPSLLERPTLVGQAGLR